MNRPEHHASSRGVTASNTLLAVSIPEVLGFQWRLMMRLLLLSSQLRTTILMSFSLPERAFIREASKTDRPICHLHFGHATEAGLELHETRGFPFVEVTKSKAFLLLHGA